MAAVRSAGSPIVAGNLSSTMVAEWSTAGAMLGAACSGGNAPVMSGAAHDGIAVAAG